MVRLILAIIPSAAIIVAAAAWNYASEHMFDLGVSRIALLLGADVAGGGYIQFFTYVAFFWALFEIVKRSRSCSKEAAAFDMHLLPEKEHYVVGEEEIRKVQKDAIARETEKSRRFLLTSVIKTACTKYLRTKSVAEVIEVIHQQSELNRARAETDQSVIRYLLWAIPSIGFVGTVIGISQALGISHIMMDGNTDGLVIVTRTLGVAFDTTLVALVLNLIATWFYHQMQSNTDNLHTDIEQYSLENLVNRIAE